MILTKNFKTIRGTGLPGINNDITVTVRAQTKQFDV